MMTQSNPLVMTLIAMAVSGSGGLFGIDAGVFPGGAVAFGQAQDTGAGPIPNPHVLQTFDDAIETLHAHEPWESVSTKLRRIGKTEAPAQWDEHRRGLWLDRQAQARELADLMRRMAEEPVPEPLDPDASVDQQVAYHVFHLRDVAVKPYVVPGKASLVGWVTQPGSDNAADALRRIGKPAVPALIGLLNDRRPTRSISTGLNGSYVLRYQDAALQLLEAIAGRPFAALPGRGRYLGNAGPEKRREVIEAVEQWWAGNRDRPEPVWLAEAVEQQGIGSDRGRIATARRLIELDPSRATDALRVVVRNEPLDPWAGNLLDEAIAATSEVTVPGTSAPDIERESNRP